LIFIGISIRVCAFAVFHSLDGTRLENVTDDKRDHFPARAWFAHELLVVEASGLDRSAA
jgi:hypothetical protein